MKSPSSSTMLLLAGLFLVNGSMSVATGPPSHANGPANGVGNGHPPPLDLNPLHAVKRVMDFALGQPSEGGAEAKPADVVSLPPSPSSRTPLDASPQPSTTVTVNATAPAAGTNATPTTPPTASSAGNAPVVKDGAALIKTQAPPASSGGATGATAPVVNTTLSPTPTTQPPSVAPTTAAPSATPSTKPASVAPATPKTIAETGATAPVNTTSSPTPTVATTPTSTPASTVAPTAAATPVTTATPSPSNNTDTVPANWRDEMMALINRERAQRQLPALCLNGKLIQTSQSHADDMAKNDFFTHFSSQDNANPFDRMSKVGFTGGSENLAAEQKSVSEVIQSLMQVDRQRENILGNYTLIGLGHGFSATAKYQHYWVQDFGNSATETCG